MLFTLKFTDLLTGGEVRPSTIYLLMVLCQNLICANQLTCTRLSYSHTNVNVTLVYFTLQYIGLMYHEFSGNKWPLLIVSVEDLLKFYVTNKIFIENYHCSKYVQQLSLVMHPLP